ncbi:N-6 DNA methylase [Edaphobacter bradus]|uniref:N-6 DNA methylase n=1 Tax=Edaphobacter bradus TaxID=2259016 RepID=UPI0021DF54B0|nr:N-6 DNA methylase [Edaphobacter bradus]
MSRLRSNEWNFSGNAAALISELLKDESFADSDLGHAEPELTEYRGARRLDLVIFSRNDPSRAMVTGELKVPWDRQGRTPYNTSVVEDAYKKAGTAGAEYFITWNVRRIVLWKTDQPGTPLSDRVVYDRELFTQEIKDQKDLRRQAVQEALKSALEDLLRFISSLFAGQRELHFLPIDRIFIARLESALDHPIAATEMAITERMVSERAFKLQLNKWMRDAQGWPVTEANEAENVQRAARFTCYVLVNRLCFYNALRRKYSALPRLTVANNVTTGPMLERKLISAFADARRFTGDYETVFEGDFGDRLPVLSDDAIGDWRDLIRLLDNYDFAHIDVDVIGSMYERLITPAERHRYGQHYTQPLVVDLMAALSIEGGEDKVLDPGCGGGTFLVGAYKRKAKLDPDLDHSELLASLYGCDVLQYACHLTTINLAIRDLIDDDNFPRVHCGDFLDYNFGDVFSSQPYRVQAGGLPVGRVDTSIAPDSLDVVIGNPPYINARLIPTDAKKKYLAYAQQAWPTFEWKPSSDIFLYFWLHAAKSIRQGGRLALLTQAAWLDVDFGIPLQDWMLSNFEIEAIIESDAEPWFTGARVATTITVLKRTSVVSRNHSVRFVQLNKPLRSIVAHPELGSPEAVAEAILGGRSFESYYRNRAVPQQQLRTEGLSEGGVYVGSRWGRHLRTPDTLYELYGRFSDSFVKLADLGSLRRGITTNCDDFFLVEDVSADSLERLTIPQEFKELHGVPRNAVVSGDIKIVARKDGVQFALPAASLQPVMKTARDFRALSTGCIENKSYVVRLGANRRAHSPLERSYILAGERERWHLSPSFAEHRNEWFVLRETQPAPLLFPKTSQYFPSVLWNDASLLANQRLYEILPDEAVDALALWALLNSTLFAFERYTAAKALGIEAAIDIEVFTAEQLRVPNLLTMSRDHRIRLRRAAKQLLRSEPEPALDVELMSLGKGAALDFVARTPICKESWPPFMTNDAREEIDLILLESLGLKENETRSMRERICDELMQYTRKLKLLEFQGQENRRGINGATRTSPKEMAQYLLPGILAEKQLTLMAIPNGFISENIACRPFHIPAPGELIISPPDLFSGGDIRGKIKGRTLSFSSEEQARLVGLLSGVGLSGTYNLPFEPEDCHLVFARINDYLATFQRELTGVAEAVTSDTHVQAQILSEAMKAVVHTRDNN